MVKGVYLLFLKLSKRARIRVGSLGYISFEKGLYVYVGSAQNNLEKRVMRHMSRRKKIKWHIDYLTSNKNARIIATYAYKLEKRYECIIADYLSKNCLEEIPRFGCSDCRCRSHLFRLKDDVEEICSKVSRMVGVKPVKII